MSTKTLTKPKTKKYMLAPGHRACAGCGQMIAARTVADTLGPNTIIANGTGCLEVTTTPYPESSWGMPWIHSLFENAAGVASGVRAALDYKNKNGNRGKSPKGDTKVVAQGGDGSTFDIGFGLISGMWERGEDILYVCYDNESYANTGIQASGATPWAANTNTTPAGKCMKSAQPSSLNGKKENCPIDAIGSHQRKKDMIAIALAHRLNYVAQTTAAFPDDIVKKIKKAMAMPGPAYVQILVPCVPGWQINSALTVKAGRLAAQTGLYPVLEYINGRLNETFKAPKPRPKVDEYLKMQGRFSHLFKTKQGEKQIKFIQHLADENIRKYGLK